MGALISESNWRATVLRWMSGKPARNVSLTPALMMLTEVTMLETITTPTRSIASFAAVCTEAAPFFG